MQFVNKLANKGIDINELKCEKQWNSENYIWFSPEDNHVRGETIYVYIKIPAGSYSCKNFWNEIEWFNDFYRYEYYECQRA